MSRLSDLRDHELLADPEYYEYQVGDGDTAREIIAALKKAESDAARVIELEDAITEAGIILSSAAAEAVPYQTMKRAMQRLGQVMNDPAVLKRQGI